MKKINKWVCLALASIFPSLALAARPILYENYAHVLWTQVAGILVIFMTIPGLALFYSGLVQRKNALSVISQCFVILAISSLLWVSIGYSLCFSDGGVLQPFIGGIGKFWLAGIKPDNISDLSTGSTHTIVFLLFQLGFAVIAPALIIGSVAERVKFSALILFVAFWEILVYYPICHWAWGGGWLENYGMLDFAGGAVVHANAGISGMVAALLMGKRRGYLTKELPPHNIILVAIGASILWIGWFGFNAGGAGHLSLSGMTILVTQVAASACILTWLFIDWLRGRKGQVNALSILFAAVAGLVAITPASGYCGIFGAILVGMGAGLICPWFLGLKLRLAYDDTLDVFGIHGVAGIVGGILTGVVATKALGGVGLPMGHGVWFQLWVQIFGLLAVGVWSALGSYILLKLIDKWIGIRVAAQCEEYGLDISVHGEESYREPYIAPPTKL